MYIIRMCSMYSTFVMLMLMQFSIVSQTLYGVMFHGAAKLCVGLYTEVVRLSSCPHNFENVRLSSEAIQYYMLDYIHLIANSNS